MSNSNLLIFARETAKGFEVGIFPPKPDRSNKPVTLRYDKEGNGVRFLESTTVSDSDRPTLGMKYVTLSDEELNVLASRFEGANLTALNKETTFLIESTEHLYKRITATLKVNLTKEVHQDAVEISKSEEGIRVPDNYSAKTVYTIFYELNDELYTPSAVVKHLNNFKTDHQFEMSALESIGTKDRLYVESRRDKDAADLTEARSKLQMQ